jgi:hypothetical protein
LDIKRELNSLGEEISKAKEDLARDKGSINTLLKRLREEENISSLDEAIKEESKISKEMDLIEENIISKIGDLKNIYEWE